MGEPSGRVWITRMEDRQDTYGGEDLVGDAEVLRFCTGLVESE